MAERLNPAPDPFPGENLSLISQLVAGLAARGLGVVLGVAPRGRGIKRITRMPEGFRSRFEQAFHTSAPALTRYATRRVSDPGLAEDIVQRAFEKVWRRQQTDPKDILNLDAYMQTAVTNEVNRELANVIPLRQQAQIDDHTRDTLPADIDVQARVAEADELASALTTLPPREQEAVVLRYQCELTVEETAQRMKVTTGAVKRYTSDGLRRLREQIAA